MIETKQKSDPDAILPNSIVVFADEQSFIGVYELSGEPLVVK